MELIKRRILLENSRDKNDNSKHWGKLTASTFYVSVFITQNIDDMGIFTDMEYIKRDILSAPVDYSILIAKLNSIGADFQFMHGRVPSTKPVFTETQLKTLRLTSKTESDYYYFGESPITGLTDSKYEDLQSYSLTFPFQEGFDINKESYVNYKGVQLIGVDRIKSNKEPRIYVFDTVDNGDLGTKKQTTGLRYIEYTGKTRQVVINGVINTIPITSVNYIGQGINQTNTSLSALTKEEYLFGIVSRPEVESDIFIDRGITKVMDLHLRLSEIGNMGELMNYGNGFYKINKQ